MVSPGVLVLFALAARSMAADPTRCSKGNGPSCQTDFSAMMQKKNKYSEKNHVVNAFGGWRAGSGAGGDGASGDGAGGDVAGGDGAWTSCEDLGGISLKESPGRRMCFNAGCDRAKMGRKGCAKIKDPAGLGVPQWGRNNCCKGKIKRSCQDSEPPCKCRKPGKCRQGDTTTTTTTTTTTMCAFVPHPTIPTDAVAYYPFSCNADDAIGMNNGDVKSPPGSPPGSLLTTDRRGIWGQAYDFRGDSFPHIDIPNSPITSASSFSMCFWMHVDAASVDCNVWPRCWNVIYSTDASEEYSVQFWLGVNSQNSRIRLHFGGMNYVEFINKPSILGQWQHVCLIGDKPERRMTLYINGQPGDAKDFNFDGDPFPSGAWGHLGVFDHWWGPQPFQGKMDDVIFYDKVLLASDIDCLFQSTCSTR